MTETKFKYIFFDLDGTLTDPYEGITKCFQYALDYYGIKVEQTELTRVIGPPLIDSFCNFYGFDRETGFKAVDKYRERYNTIGWKENRLLDGIEDLLIKLKNDNRIIALATSKPYIFADRILKEYNIDKYFDVVVGAELDLHFGSKTDVIKKSLSLLDNPDKSKVIMVGDRKYDIESAKELGIHSLGVRFGYAEDGELEKAGADFIADTETDMIDFLINN